MGNRRRVLLAKPSQRQSLEPTDRAIQETARIAAHGRADHSIWIARCGGGSFGLRPQDEQGVTALSTGSTPGEWSDLLVWVRDRRRIPDLRVRLGVEFDRGLVEGDYVVAPFRVDPPGAGCRRISKVAPEAACIARSRTAASPRRCTWSFSSML